MHWAFIIICNPSSYHAHLVELLILCSTMYIIVNVQEYSIKNITICYTITAHTAIYSFFFISNIFFYFESSKFILFFFFTGKFCGDTKVPDVLISGKYRMLVTYRTSTSNAGHKGFKAHYEGIN